MVSQAELIETITHLAFYAGWPNAITAIPVVKEVFANRGRCAPFRYLPQLSA
jgi:4-carboxymuconolactone decarboxylase